MPVISKFENGRWLVWSEALGAFIVWTGPLCTQCGVPHDHKCNSAFCSEECELMAEDDADTSWSSHVDPKDC